MQLIELFKNIPAKTFHSAVFTSYNINLYYWEMDVMKVLAGKGISYVSAVVDSDMLSEELLYYTDRISDKQRNYALFGFHASGAFHPKIMFFAGNNAILVLIGSGNLTLTGHGKNLETWNSIMIESKEDVKLGFVKEVWHYLSDIYGSIGRQAKEIINTIEAHCELLNHSAERPDNGEYPYRNGSIRFFYRSEKPIINQLYEWTKNDVIDKITVLSPFYDTEGLFLQQLNEYYKPKELDVIFEEGFGNIPPKLSNNNVMYYNWKDVRKTMQRKASGLPLLYHAKCFFFHGANFNYMLTGSANASIAAFGNSNHVGSNYEACIGYKSEETDFLKLSDINLNENKRVSDIPIQPMLTAKSQQDENNAYVVIKEAVVEDDWMEIDVLNLKNDVHYALCLHSSKEEKSLEIAKATNSVKIKLEEGLNPLYVYITLGDGTKVSNRQMVVYKEVMEANDPSELNRKFKEFCNNLEDGNILSSKVLEYLTDIMMGESKKKITVYNGTKNVGRQIVVGIEHYDSKEDFDKEDLSEEYLNQKLQKHNRRTEMIFDSVLSFIRHSYEQEAEANYDNDENLEIEHSYNRQSNRVIASDSSRNFERNRERIVKALDRFIENLSTKVVWFVKGRMDLPKNKPSLEDLMKYVLALGVVSRIVGTPVKIKDGEMAGDVRHYLSLTMADKANIVVYLHKIIGLFTLWVNQQQGFLMYDNDYQQKRLDKYINEAYGLSMACMSLCDLFNQSDKNYHQKEQIRARSELLISIRRNMEIKQTTSDKAKDILTKVDGDIMLLDQFDDGQFKNIVNENLLLSDYDGLGKSDVNGMIMTREMGPVVITGKTLNPDIVHIDSFLKKYISSDTSIKGSDSYGYSFKMNKVVRFCG